MIPRWHSTWRLFLGVSMTGMAAHCPAQNVSFPSPAHAPEGETYRVEVDGQPIRTEQFRDVSFASFPFTRPIEVTVRVKSPIEDFDLSPHAARLVAQPRGKALTFTIDRPCQLVLTIDRGEKLFLFAEPGDSIAPVPGGHGVFNVLDFGVDKTGQRLETKRLQQAIDEVSAAKGTLYFPPGRYLTGALSLKSHLTLHLAEGARLLASDNPDHYPADPGSDDANIRWDPAFWAKVRGLDVAYRRLILIDGAKHVRVTGRGIIEGRGKALMRGADSRFWSLPGQQHPEGGKPLNILCILIRQSADVMFEGVTLLDSPMYNAHVLASDRVTFRNVKIISDPTVPNTDGIDPDSSRDVLIEGCFFYCADDCVSIKTSGQSRLTGNAERIMVRNCVFISQTSATKFGFESFGGVLRDITFENNDILEADRAITLSCMFGNYYDNLRFIDTRVERLIGRRLQFPVHVHVRQGHPSGGAGRIHNVLFENLSVAQEYPNPSKLAGFSPQHDVRGVHFVNYTIAGRVRLNAAEANVDIGPFVSEVTFTGPLAQPCADGSIKRLVRAWHSLTCHRRQRSPPARSASPCSG